jgi:L-lactate dehydrogenase complex protein LldE
MRDVSLFIPCTVDLFAPRIGEAVVNILRRVGVNPIYHEEQTCCGQPAMNAGYREEAKKVAKHFISVFEKDEDRESCGLLRVMVKDHYPEILEGEPDWLRRAQALAPRLYEFSQYLVDVLKVEDVGASFQGKVTYHESCHILRGLGVSEQPKKLIQAVNAQWSPSTTPIPAALRGSLPTISDISESMVKDKVESFWPVALTCWSS